MDVVALSAMGFSAGIDLGLLARMGYLSYQRAPHDHHQCVNSRSFPIAIHSPSSHSLGTVIC